MNPDNGEGSQSAESNRGPASSRERRAESAKAWQQMQYMGSMPDLGSNDESVEEEV